MGRSRFFFLCSDGEQFQGAAQARAAEVPPEYLHRIEKWRGSGAAGNRYVKRPQEVAQLDLVLLRESFEDAAERLLLPLDDFLDLLEQLGKRLAGYIIRHFWIVKVL